jgi:hypothetical protein
MMLDIFNGNFLSNDNRNINIQIYKYLRNKYKIEIEKCAYDESYLEAITTFMDNNYEKFIATVTLRESGEKILNTNRRSGAKLTFGKDLVSEIFKVLQLNIFKEIKKQYSSSELKYKSIVNDSHVLDIVPEESHGDLLYYRLDDEFKFHRDTISDKSPRKDYVMYSILIGLTPTSEDEAYLTKCGGETLIVDSKSKKVKKFLDSRIFGNYVMFPSNEKHASAKINLGYKMCLKLDLWIKFNQNQEIIVSPDKRFIKPLSNDFPENWFEIIKINLLLRKIFKYESKIYEKIIYFSCYKNYSIDKSVSFNLSKINCIIPKSTLYFYVSRGLIFEHIDYNLDNAIDILSLNNQNEYFTEISEIVTDMYNHQDYYSDEEDDMYCNGDW